MLHLTEEPPLAPNSTLVIVAVILITLLFIGTLVSLRRAKIRRQKAARAQIKAGRREGYIQSRLDDEEAFIESLKTQGSDGPGRASINRTPKEQ